MTPHLSSGMGPCGISITGWRPPDFLDPAMDKLSPMKPGLISPWYMELGFMYWGSATSISLIFLLARV